MFFALNNCIHVSICKHLSKKTDEGIKTKLLSFEKFPLFPSVYKLYTDLSKEKFFLASSSFVFLNPVQRFHNVMMSKFRVFIFIIFV